MQATGGDPDFGAKAELTTVAELCAGIPQRDRTSDARQELPGGVGVFGDDRLGMRTAIAGDVIERCVHAVDHGDRQGGAEPLSAEIFFCRGRQSGHGRARARIGPKCAAECGEVCNQVRQECGCAGGVDQQRLGGATHAGAAHFRVCEDRTRHGRVGRGMDVGVAEAVRVGEYGDAGVALNPLDQRAAASGDEQVDGAGPVQHGGDERAVGAGRDLHSALRQPSGAEARDHGTVDHGGGAKAVAAAAQDGGVAGFDAQPGRVGADIRAALVHDADYADRAGDALELQTVGPGPCGERTGERVWQGCDLVEARSHRGGARGGEGQAVAHGVRAVKRGEVLAVGVE